MKKENGKTEKRQDESIITAGRKKTRQQLEKENGMRERRKKSSGLKRTRQQLEIENVKTERRYNEMIKTTEIRRTTVNDKQKDSNNT